MGGRPRGEHGHPVRGPVVIAAAPRPSGDLPAVVWEQYCRADKDRTSVLRASAAWISAPHPVQATGRPS